ncbi:unnamed protein product [Schistocephalus solidus]|uniref:Uncharacterized protein n=1 Tax=Schistocephalus solidus TaxID=70667 RepID=A0A183SAG2_SCHSO|nr:unnamed protein product [Schistocephalus solidus]
MFLAVAVGRRNQIGGAAQPSSKCSNIPNPYSAKAISYSGSAPANHASNANASEPKGRPILTPTLSHAGQRAIILDEEGSC